jgi:heptosyltransferase-1
MTRILIVRMGAMGDVIHTLPAVASLKHSLPGARLSWLIESRWAPLLEGNPFVDDVIALNRRDLSSIRRAAGGLRAERFDMAIDFQGLMKSALAATLARPDRILGFHPSQLRERVAGLSYSHYTEARAAHVVDRNLELAAAAGAASIVRAFPLPEGRDPGGLPEGPFVLASPLAGWTAKEWPLENYHALARALRRDPGLELVVAGPPGEHYRLGPEYWPSDLAGLIHATRRATAVIGVDSGPIHLAAALGKPGVAVFGPTDPARNGPYGDSIAVLRDPRAATSYRRQAGPDESMRAIAPQAVYEALQARLALVPQAQAAR